jgi:hypothetical protein
LTSTAIVNYAAATLRKTKTISEKVEMSSVIHYNTILRATDYKMRSKKGLVMFRVVLEFSFIAWHGTRMLRRSKVAQK